MPTRPTDRRDRERPRSRTTLAALCRWLMRAAAGPLVIAALPQPATAQQQPAPMQAQVPAQPPQPAAPQFQPSLQWTNLPKMILERQFSGPLQDTVIQRLRDPVDGTVCYVYLPISAPHSPTTATGFVQYGPNTVGNISCMPGRSGPPVSSVSGAPAQRR
ncbi:MULTISPECIES: hypothetical protein [unclassified Bradyrhizobium]|uniref:hypothetical protein n=1 Tax=unclassified Bradyrhizobium TaxID=2631580 RepID=UPI0028E72E7F|nr:MULTISPECIES: hypothetical protein [unclassified Bradyrhizobium]